MESRREILPVDEAIKLEMVLRGGALRACSLARQQSWEEVEAGRQRFRAWVVQMVEQDHGLAVAPEMVNVLSWAHGPYTYSVVLPARLVLDDLIAPDLDPMIGASCGLAYWPTGEERRDAFVVRPFTQDGRPMHEGYRAAGVTGTFPTLLDALVESAYSMRTTWERLRGQQGRR
jgi:hypothetical protein